ncbi:cell adhesion molecule CEACAM21-like [Urocitellus parryii]
MQPPSACPCRGCIPWQGVLLAVSLLTFWNPHPTAQLTVEPVPSDVAEGRDVLLLVHNVSGNTVGYSWYRGQVTNQNLLIVTYSNLTHSATQGPAFSGRETIYPNGSLLFVNVTKGDTGFYTLQTTTPNFQSETATGEFRVYEPVTPPHLTASNTTVAEGDSVQLTCVPNDTEISIQWLFNNKILQLTDRMQLSLNNSILTINPVQKTDEGEYQCQVSNPIFSLKSNPITLTVIAERTPGLPVGAVAGIVTGVLVGVALVAALGCLLLHTRTGRGLDLQPRGTVNPHTAQTPPLMLDQDKAPVTGHKTAVPIYQELLNPDVDIYCRVDHTAIGGS